MRARVLGVLAGLLGAAVLWAGVPVTIQPTDYIGVPDKGKVKYRELAVENGNKAQVSYLSFDMGFVKAVSEIESVSLMLPVKKVKGSGVAHLYWVLSPWNAEKIDYWNRPATGAKVASFYIDRSNEEKVVKVDLTEAFKDWGYLANSNHGILFETYDALEVEFTKGMANSKLAGMASQIFDENAPRFELIFAPLVGPQGIQGEVGPQGIQGEVGSQGVAGPVGPKGDTGATGATGPQGIQGEVGTQGVAGPVGPKGDTGATGATGPQGIQGEVGTQGVAGPVGPKGDTGATGATGPQGIQGEVGTQGIQGEVGPQGVAGPVGPQGIQGEVGPQGIQGEVGPQGVAGPVGPKGDTGATGATGPQGPAGDSAGSASGVASLLARGQGYAMASVGSTYANIQGRALTFTKSKGDSLLRVRYEDLMGTSMNSAAMVTATWRVLLNGNAVGGEKALVEYQAAGLHLEMRSYEWILSGVPAGSYTLTVQAKVSGATSLLHGYQGINVDNHLEVLEVL